MNSDNSSHSTESVNARDFFTFVCLIYCDIMNTEKELKPSFDPSR